ncbi:MAG: hypothetical protein CUN54_09675, partial [Phototrophicales bacterium]
GDFHADFANQYLGGGVLHGGCVQEEILFMIKPECLVGMLVCAKMDENEAIVISGAEQFSKYRGYGTSVRYDGTHVDQHPFNKKLDCLDNHICAYDADVAFFNRNFALKTLHRNLVKAYAAFSSPEKIKPKPNGTITSKYQFVTGNWGCGAFGGNKEEKALIQIMSASVANVD